LPGQIGCGGRAQGLAELVVGHGVDVGSERRRKFGGRWDLARFAPLDGALRRADLADLEA